MYDPYIHNGVHICFSVEVYHAAHIVYTHVAQAFRFLVRFDVSNYLGTQTSAVILYVYLPSSSLCFQGGRSL